jgi:hypothetical protein
MTIMAAAQAPDAEATLDTLVPPPGSPGRRAVIGVAVVAVIAVLAVVPISGVASPNLASTFRSGSGGSPDRGGDFRWVIANRGWFGATVDDLDPGIAGLRDARVSYRAYEDGVPGVGPALSPPVRIAPGRSVTATLTFSGYDCGQVRASGGPPVVGTVRGLLPWAVGVDLSAQETPWRGTAFAWVDSLTESCARAGR